MRTAGALGWDSNVLETMNASARTSDTFVRMLADAETRRFGHGRFAATGKLRGLTERYFDHPSESRFQGEAGADLSMLVGRRGNLRASLFAQGRSYPDTVARNYTRQWANVGWSGPLRRGSFALTGTWRGIDYRRTPRHDRSSRSLRMEYVRAIRRGPELRVGAMFEWANYGRPSVKLPYGEPGQGPYLGSDQRDRGRALLIGVRYQRGWLWDLGLGWESVRSNSIGYSVGRRSLELGATGWIPGQILVQVKGRTEGTSYHDRGLDEVYIPRTGEDLESGQDNNSLQIFVERGLAGRLVAEGRCGWYRNESLLVGFYYEKAIVSLGVSWRFGAASVF